MLLRSGLPRPAEEPLTAEARRAACLEVAVVVAVGVVPSVVHAVTWIAWPRPSPRFYVPAVEAAAWSLQILAAVLYVMHRSGEPWGRFGLVRPRWAPDAVLAAGILFFAYAGTWAGWRSACGLLRVTGDEPWLTGPGVFDLPSDVMDYVLLVPVEVAAIAAAQELVFRAFLIPRLEQLLGSAWKSIALSSALFAGCYAYNGLYGVVGAFAFGVVAGITFWTFGRISPVVLAHAAGDVIAYLP